MMDSEGLCDITINYFNQLFSDSIGTAATVIDLVQPKVTDLDNDLLLVLFTKEEFKTAFF